MAVPAESERPVFPRPHLLSWLLLAIMFAGPFVRINGNPLLLVNIVERKFVILGQIFWPQDMIMFAVALLVFITGIIIFTAAFGRLWCGWTCPQTVLMEMVFRKIEYLIEGDSHQQRALDKAPWTARQDSQESWQARDLLRACRSSSAIPCWPTSSAPNSCSRS